jgi:single-stranded-DNA-specific exonuclease
VRIAAQLDELNKQRQEIETRALAEAMAEADAEIGAGEGPPVLVTASSGWHPGVVGLIASRLKDRFQRPAIAIGFMPNGVGSGSGRSIVGVDLGHAIRSAVERGILVKGGGHAMAAGLTVAQDRLGDLRAFLQETLAARLRAAADPGGIAIDAALSARGATVELIEALDRAGPFGSGHPEPMFAFPAHRVAYVEVVGNGHVRLSLAASDGAELRGVLFRGAGTPLGQALLAARGRILHVAGTLSIDQYQHQRRANLRIVDAAELPADG